MPNKEARRVKAAMHNVAQLVRAYCRSQRKLWMEIPYLALEADGRSGFSDQYSGAMHYQLWRIEIGQVQAWICLFTGQIVCINDTARLENDETVVQFADHLELLDARKIAYQLRREAATPIDSCITPRTKKYKDEIRRQLEWVPERGPLAMQFD